MKYINAKKILPDCLIRELQQYTQGSYLYIPVEEGQHKDWGEISGYKVSLAKRNQHIATQFKNGTTVNELSEQYFLSTNAIRKIINKK